MPDSPLPNTAPAEKAPPVPQTPIRAELDRVYDQVTAAKAEKTVEKPAAESRGTAVSAGQGVPPPESKARDEGGRFASAKPDAKPEPKTEAKTDAKPETKVGAEAKDAKAPDAKPAAAAEVKPDIKPHPRWKPDVQEKFTKLAAADPDLAKFVLERQKETEGVVTKATQAAAHGEKFKALDDVLAPGRQARSMQGVDDPTYMRALVAASEFLTKEPAKGLRMLAQQYGVDLKQLADGGEAAPDNPALRALEERIAKQDQFIQSIVHGSQQQKLHGAVQTIESFKQLKDEQGQPKYPHFDEVMEDITTVVARQIEAGQQPDLDAAYVKAIRLNDSVWTKTQAAKSDAERKLREEEETRRVQAAKLAGFSASGSGAGGDQVAGSIRDELARQLDKRYR